MKPAFDPLAQRYVSARYPICARDGMVNHSIRQAPCACRYAGRTDGGRKRGRKNPADLLTCRALHVPKMGLEPIRF